MRTCCGWSGQRNIIRDYRLHSAALVPFQKSLRRSGEAVTRCPFPSIIFTLMKRRDFLKTSAGALCGVSALPLISWKPVWARENQSEWFDISLAQWSLNKTLRAGKMTNLDFPRVARQEFGIDCIEFVDQFFADKARDENYLKELRQRARDEGVKLGLIMLDTNGPLGAASQAERHQAVDKTFAWIDAAKFLGCHTVRINAYGPGDADELRGRIVESCSRLADYASARDINVAIENHGGLSSDADWLVSVMKEVNRPNFGTLPDFGNFSRETNRYDAVEKMMPYAKAVSAKAERFTEDGLVQETDFFRMMRLVRDGGYQGYVGVESGARTQEGEAAAIKMTRDLLQRIREEHSRRHPIFNGRDLSGWKAIEGGEWIIREGILTGKNGKNWTTNPEVAGSWLRTEKEYGDFRLELQYTVNERGNSGVFFRSAAEKNPAFTGYEMQIYDAPGRPPSKTGPTSIYDVVAPEKNRVRPAGEWNTVTIVARGPRVQIEMNGEQVMDTQLDRSLHGYIGLQNHDDRSVVKFKNIRLEEL
jgi:L-ribulose-5-phosphate 3-epimerase